MCIEEKFQNLLEGWKIHCKSVSHHSNPHDYLNYKSYNEIVKLGPQALPLIKEVYSQVNENTYFSIMGWTNIVSEIVGKDFIVPKKIYGQVEAIRNYTVNWLDENMNKYINS